MKSYKNKYLIVTIDTECDKGPGWRVRHPISFEGIYRGVSDILQPLFNKYGVKATYLLSPEVIKDRKSAEIFKDISKEGHELGTHLHGEFIEPFPTENPEITEELACEYPDDIEFEKLKNLTILFTETFGFKPQSYRAGRFSVCNRTIRFLERLGYRVDSSLTPYSIVSGVDHRRAPVYPYFPDYNDIYSPGNSKILEVPITIVQQNPLLFDILKKTPAYRIRRIRKLIKKAFGNIWLRPTVSDLADVKKLVLIYEKMFPDRDSYLVLMFHNVEVVEGLSPYNSKKVLKNLREILEFFMWEGYESIKLVETYEKLKENI